MVQLSLKSGTSDPAPHQEETTMKSTLMFAALGLAANFNRVFANEAGEGNDLGGTQTPASGTRIRPNLEGYQKARSASGSTTKICGDEVSVALVGATLDETYGFVAKVTGVGEDVLREKYGAKNPGQQRMFLGNLIRGAYNGKDKEKAERVKAAFDAHLAGFRTAIDARMAQVAEAKEAEAKRKAEEKQKQKEEAAAKKAEAKKQADAKKAEDKPAQPAKPAAPKAPAQPQQ